jgi:hypothetical protein
MSQVLRLMPFESGVAHHERLSMVTRELEWANDRCHGRKLP